MRQAKLYLFFPMFLISIGLSSANGQEKQSALWEISGNGLTKTSYLLGTVHTSSTEILNKFKKLKRLMENAEIGLFEINGTAVGDQPIANEDHIDVPQPPLDSIFTPAEYELVDDFFAKSPLGSIRPHNNDASLDGMLQVAITYKSNKRNQYITLDHYLNRLMDSLGKDIFQLDDANDRSKIAFQTHHRKIAKILLAVIKSEDSKIAESYIPVDYEKYLIADLKLTDQPAELVGSVTIERNRIWLPKIIEKIKSNTCFIAVGLGHLQYNTGLIALLRAHNYKLKPIDVTQ